MEEAALAGRSRARLQEEQDFHPSKALRKQVGQELLKNLHGGFMVKLICLLFLALPECTSAKTCPKQDLYQ